MHPHTLHALAAAWSLQAARRVLAECARDEAARNIWAEQLPAAPISSPTYGTIHAIGSHADPVSGSLAVEEPLGRHITWATRLTTAERRISGIARMLRIDTPRPLARIIEAIPRIQPGTAAVLARHLADEDRILRSRDWLDLPSARVPLVGVDCPACRHRTLHVQTEGPRETWTVVCAGSRPPGGEHNPCLCTGQGCPCGMVGAVEGVAHIWPRDAVLGAVGGAR